MAKTTRTNSPAKAPALVARRRGRPPESKSAKPAAAPAARKTRQPAVAAKPVTTARKPPAAPSAPRPSKGELQAQVEKLERTVATLRSSLTRAAKGSMARIEELEEKVTQLEEAAIIRPAPTAEKSKPARVPRSKRQSQDVDRVEAVPPAETDETT